MCVCVCNMYACMHIDIYIYIYIYIYMEHRNTEERKTKQQVFQRFVVSSPEVVVGWLKAGYSSHFCLFEPKCSNFLLFIQLRIG